MYKLKQAYYLTKERVKECKENNFIYSFLSINKIILLLLIAIELLFFISLIIYLFNNRQDNIILFYFIIFKVSLVTHAVYRLANWLRFISFYPPLELLIRVT